MPISISLNKRKTSKPECLPKLVIEDIVNSYSGLTDIGQRLWLLPIIPKSKQHNTYPRTNVNQYAVDQATQSNLDVYIGYFVYKHPQRNTWALHEHVFNVDKAGKVQEHARDMDWTTTCHYVGMKVPVDDYKNTHFANQFSDIGYIKRFSARALFDLPKEKV